MALKAINDALMKLTGNEPALGPNKIATDVNDVFSFEDTFATNDLKVTVKNVGEIPVPMTEEFVKKIITVSAKAKFGKGEATVLDTKVRDTQMIPASNLTVEIEDKCLANLLTRAKSGLNITQKSTLVPHLHNMLVYGPGQFFKMHRDSEKVPNMVATLVIVLPSFHKGGDLVIQHGNSKHVFFGSQNDNFIKCIIFYADCLHEIQPVIEGYRVAITYNVVLNPCDDITDAEVNGALNNAVKEYFSPETKTEKPEKLVYALDHSYSESNLKWDLLKGKDRTQAFALLGVAKKQNLFPYLALGSFREVFDIEYDSDEENPLDQETELNYWIDEQNIQFSEDISVRERELCFLTKTSDLFEPYQTEASGPTGNEGNTVEHWYRRAFVVLWSDKWDFEHGYKECLREFYKLTLQKEKEPCLLEEIKKNKSNFFQAQFWNDPEVIKYLLDIVAYLNDKKMAVSILSKLPRQIIQPDGVVWVLRLEDQFDDETLLKILEHWSEERSDLPKVPLFVEAYLKHPGKKLNSLIIKYLSEKHVEQYLARNTDFQDKYDDFESFYDLYHSSKVNDLWLELKMCIDLGNSTLENKLIQHVLDNSRTFQPKLLLEFLVLIESKLSPDSFLSYKCLRDAASKCIDTKILDLKDENCWKMSSSPYCYMFCDACSQVEKFLRSNNTQKHNLSANEKVRKHISKQLKTLEKAHYLVLTTDKSSRPHTLEIKKGKRVFQENKNKVSDLKTLKSSLEEIKFLGTKENSSNSPETSLGESLAVQEKSNQKGQPKPGKKAQEKSFQEEDCPTKRKKNK